MRSCLRRFSRSGHRDQCAASAGSRPASYGVPVLRDDRQSYREAAAALRAAVPGEHVAFLGSLKTSLTVGRTSCATPACVPVLLWSARGSMTS